MSDPNAECWAHLTLVIEVEPHPGRSIQDTARDMIKVAEAHLAIVKTDFNGYPIRASWVMANDPDKWIQRLTTGYHEREEKK